MMTAPEPNELPFPEGDIDETVLRPMQRKAAIVCRYCGRPDVRSYGRHGGFAYYQCAACVYPKTGKPFRFRVVVN